MPRSCWEREICSQKKAAEATLGAQLVTEKVPTTVLTEIKGFLNFKPAVVDRDPVTPTLC